MYSHEELLIIANSFKVDHPEFNIIGGSLEFTDGFIPTAEEMEAVLLLDAKKKGSDAVDTFYENLRQTYLTAGPTMSMIYSLKAEEAARYTENPIEDSTLYPFLSSSIQAGEASSLLEAASLVLSKRAELIGLAAQLESQRLSKKIAINNATSVAEIESILS